MARFDELPADQQAVLRLLLTREASYDDIASDLGMAPAAVRDRAAAALEALGPAGSPPADRAAIGDWLLRQRDDAPASLSADDRARAWATRVRAELTGIGSGRLPDVPDAQPAAREAGAAAPAAAAAAPRGSRVGGAILLTGAAVLGALVIGFFVGRATKDDGGSTSASTTKTTTASKVIGQANLQPVQGANAPKALGIAQFVTQGGKDKINVIAEGLPKTGKNGGYGVWLIGESRKPAFLGYFTAITTSGQAASQSTLKVDPRKYAAVAITRQTGSNPTTPGKAVLGGQIQFPTS